MTGIEQLQKKNKKLGTLDKYLIFSFAIMIIYTIAEMIVSSITSVTHDALTVALYAAFGGEVFCCALIKRLKLRKEIADGLDSQ